MRLWIWAGLPVLLLTACGLERARISWPAEVASIEISGDAKAVVTENIADLNKRLGSEVLSVGGKSGSPIYIKSVDSFSSSTSSIQAQGSHVDYAYVSASGKTSSRAVAGSTRIAGRATLSSDQCLIELGSFLLQPSAKDLLIPVLWHEIGHCAGLLHVTESGEMMSPVTLTLASYSDEKLKRFFDAFLASIQAP